MDELLTERLRLRRWRDADREPFAALNADSRVSQFLPTPLDHAASDAQIAFAERHFQRHGFGPYAAALRETDVCIGFIGVSIPKFEAAFTPCVEIGWRLAAEHWGKGLATEGARAVLQFAFDSLGLEEVLSWTVPANLRSQRVMQKLGMRRDPADDFDHPLLPQGHPLRRHLLYRLRKTWRSS